MTARPGLAFQVMVAGVDGCRAGWAVVFFDERTRALTARVYRTFAEVLTGTANARAVAVDVPIGLTDGPPRAADGEARRLLGRRRASSVFPAPIRAVLAARSYEEACALSKKRSGRKASRQTFAILPKIRDVDALMTPEAQGRIVEMHPEVSFWAMANRAAMGFNKKAREGAAERRRHLRRALGKAVATLPRLPGAKWDDTLDACAGAWTAWRVAEGHAGRIPHEVAADARGLRMEIVF